MTSPPPETSTRRQKYVWGAAAVALCLILLVTFRKQNSDPASPGATNPEDTNAIGAELQGQLLGTLDGLRPERLHVSSDEQNIVGDLNLWWAGYSQTIQVPDPSAAAELAGQWLGDEVTANVAAHRFTSRDAAHIRNALLYRAIAETLVANHASDLDRVMAAFDLVVRQVALMSAFVEPAPLGALEVLLSGRGAVDDRIWLFAEILRQLNIDCVLLEQNPPGDDAAEPSKLVAAILKNRDILLFDPQLGLPIPKIDDTSTALPKSAVSLRDALQNDAVFRQFDIPGGPAYPWSSATLQKAGVRFILDSTYAAPRMLIVQTALPEQYAATLFDGPPPSTGSPSLRSRIAAAGTDGLWTDDSVSAWPYPERQMTAFYDAGGEASSDARSRLATLYGPRVLELQQVEQGEQTVSMHVPVNSRRPLRIVRVEHLRGELLQALKGYGTIRSAPLEAGNAEVREDAIHWIAVCQEDLGRYDAAINTLKLLLRDYPSGLWSAVSQRSLARCEALQQNVQQAAELLPRTNEGQAPDFTGAWLRRRWLSLAESASDSPADDSAGEPQ